MLQIYSDGRIRSALFGCYFNKNLSITNLYPKSINPKNAAINKLIPITTRVYKTVWFLVGQLTFASSTLTSFRNWIILSMRFNSVGFKNRPKAYYLYRQY